ncbi:uncharacterized protein LOC129787521 isoform X2 [Lutzomyia longipalpis]|uniref:uncharacterized protein LOC129787521 isoform X2 n=1 Tax=Lutzomyia longipalpis TaxID=7200 RepID=UPI002483748D|nr:uncharacterized protein LOC129787521 isoform X2 [Lutzomyia longipalpis]
MTRSVTWLLLLVGFAFLAVSLHDAQVHADVGPSESECRPYIEKAIHDLKSGDSGAVADDDGSPETGAGDTDGPPGEDDGDDSTENAAIEETSKEGDDGADDDNNDDDGDDNVTGEDQDGDDNVTGEDQDGDDNDDGQSNEDAQVAADEDSGENADDNDEAAKSGEDDNDDDDDATNDKDGDGQDDDDDDRKDDNDDDDDVKASTENQDDDDDDDNKDEGSKEGNEDDKEDGDDNDDDDDDDNAPKSGEDDGTDDEHDDEKDSGEATEEGDQQGDSQEDENGTKADDDDDDDDDENDGKIDGDNDDDQDYDDDQKSKEADEDGDDGTSAEKADIGDNDDDDDGKDDEDDGKDDDDDDDDGKDDDDQKSGEVDEDDQKSGEATNADEDDDDDDDKDKDNEDDGQSQEADEEESDKQSEEVLSRGKRSTANDDDDDDDDDGKPDDDDDDDDQKDDGENADGDSQEDAEGKSSEDTKDDEADNDDDDDDDGVASKEADDKDKDDEDSKEKAQADDDDDDDDNPEEELTLESEIPDNRRNRDHIAELLHLDDESELRENAIVRVADVILKDLKRIYENSIKPLETLYKYRDLSNRHFSDPEIFSKPLVLFMGPWSGGKSTLINYLTNNEFTEDSLRTGAEPSPAYFNILMWGEKPEVLDGTQLAADWTFSGLQKFGQGLEDRLRGLKLPSKLLEKVNIVEIPGILEVRKQVSRLFPFNDACQWFIDRADIIFLVYDPSKLDVGPETEAILDQLKGREYQTRIILNKADQVKPEELMRVQSALIWNISPLMSSAQPPVMYTTSLWSLPFESGAPVRLLQAQERALLRDLRSAIDKRIENKIASARRFAVRVRNHAKMVDCYLTTYYNHKSLFGNKKQISDQIIEHPQNYHIYEGLSTLTNISRYDLPDPEVYRDFFRLNPLYEFKKLSETCTYFRGCPINKLDVSIAYDLPELGGKYKKLLEASLAQLEKEADASKESTGKS